MNQRDQINNMRTFILRLEKVLSEAKKLSYDDLTKLHQDTQEKITELGLYQKFTEADIVKHINTTPANKLFSPLMELWDRQTPAEKATGTSRIKNGIGFNKKDAPKAKRLLKLFETDTLPLLPQNSAAIKKLLLKYRGQLTHIANNRAFLKQKRRQNS